eukprot:15160574-Alexandrium_andersonii.AAC.1
MECSMQRGGGFEVGSPFVPQLLADCAFDTACGQRPRATAPKRSCGRRTAAPSPQANRNWRVPTQVSSVAVLT